MGLKDNLDAVKKEIGTEEQFLESIIKSERFFKKYKKIIIAVVVVLFVGGSGYAISDYLNNKRLDESNKAYLQLKSNPNDKEALNSLKSKNERLYNFYRFEVAILNKDKKVLAELASYTKDPVISDLANYELASIDGKKIEKSVLLNGFVNLQNGYNLLKEDKIKEAKLEFAKISLNSPLKNIAKNLEHYQGKSLEGNK
ncbi:hypothetical protein ACKGJI_03150 [Sulfurospirillum sp. 1307]